MEQRWNYTITYTSIDDTLRTHQKTPTFPFDANIIFQYILDYIETGICADKSSEYTPVSIALPDRTLDALTYARCFFSEFIERSVIWAISNDCTFDNEFAEVVIKHCNIVSKSLPEHEQRWYKNAKRCLREHKKNGKNLFSDYCYMIGMFALYKIVNFSFQLV